MVTEMLIAIFPGINHLLKAQKYVFKYNQMILQYTEILFINICHFVTQVFMNINNFVKIKSTMQHSAFLNIESLSEEARRELETFYQFLLFKYGKKNKNKQVKSQNQLDEFLKNPLRTDHFAILNRSERNER